MLRLARYTRDPMTNITTCILVCIGREPARQAPELRLMSKRIPGPTTRASETSIGWITEPSRHPYQIGQQENALCKESRTPLSPTRQTVRILKRNTSTRLLSTAHKGSGFFGLRLSLRRHFIRPIPPLFLVQGSSVTLSVQYRPQIGTFVAVATGDSTSYPNICPDKFSDGLLIGQRDFHANLAIPFTVLPENLALLTERCARQSECSVDSTMLSCRYVESGTILISASTPHHHPQIKTLCVPGELNLGGINQFGFQRSRLKFSFKSTSRLLSTSPINKGTTVGMSNKLAQSFAAGGSALFTQRRCADGMMPRKESRQERQCVSLIFGRIEFQLVAENRRLHTCTIAKKMWGFNTCD